MNPADRKYTKEHEWTKLEGSVALCGITHHAQELLTDIVFVELPQIGRVIEADKPLCVVESVKSVSDVYSPVTGEVIEVNKSLENDPAKINKDPYGEGWIFKLKISNPAEFENLMSAEEYEVYIKSS